MTDNVYSFHKAKNTRVPKDNGARYVYVCDCGYSDFKLIEGGQISCAECGCLHDLLWFTPDDKPVA